MKVHIDSLNITRSKFSYSNGNGWQATTLIAYVKSQELEVFDLPLIAIDIAVNPFTVNDIHQFVCHMKRCQKTDLKYPVIMDESGYIIDGWHRVSKALILGHETIKAARFKENPPFDYLGSKE